MLATRSRRIGFWINRCRSPVMVDLVSRLVSETVLVTDVRCTRVGRRWHLRIGLLKSGSSFDLKAFHRETLRTFTMRVHQRQKRRSVGHIPPLLLWRLCKDRRWHVTKPVTMPWDELFSAVAD